MNFGVVIACYASGLLSYILFFVYDYNSIKKNVKIIKSFFMLGTLINISSTVVFSVISFKNSNLASIIISSIFVFFFLFLEIYSLFFAIDFKETYIENSKERKAYTKGMYSLCRHPGVLWYILLFISLGFLINNLDIIPFYIMMIVFNVLYIVYQDYYIFPKTFVNYKEYKKETPFLIPFIKRRNK